MKRRYLESEEGKRKVTPTKVAKTKRNKELLTWNYIDEQVVNKYEKCLFEMYGEKLGKNIIPFIVHHKDSNLNIDTAFDQLSNERAVPAEKQFTDSFLFTHGQIYNNAFIVPPKINIHIYTYLFSSLQSQDIFEHTLDPNDTMSQWFTNLVNQLKNYVKYLYYQQGLNRQEIMQKKIQLFTALYEKKLPFLMALFKETQKFETEDQVYRPFSLCPDFFCASGNIHAQYLATAIGYDYLDDDGNQVVYQKHIVDSLFTLSDLTFRLYNLSKKLKKNSYINLHCFMCGSEGVVTDSYFYHAYPHYFTGGCLDTITPYYIFYASQNENKKKKEIHRRNFRVAMRYLNKYLQDKNTEEYIDPKEGNIGNFMNLEKALTKVNFLTILEVFGSHLSNSPIFDSNKIIKEIKLTNFFGSGSIKNNFDRRQKVLEYLVAQECLKNALNFQRKEYVQFIYELLQSNVLIINEIYFHVKRVINVIPNLKLFQHFPERHKKYFDEFQRALQENFASENEVHQIFECLEELLRIDLMYFTFINNNKNVSELNYDNKTKIVLLKTFNYILKRVNAFVTEDFDELHFRQQAMNIVQTNLTKGYVFEQYLIERIIKNSGIQIGRAYEYNQIYDKYLNATSSERNYILQDLSLIQAQPVFSLYEYYDIRQFLPCICLFLNNCIDINVDYKFDIAKFKNLANIPSDTFKKGSIQSRFLFCLQAFASFLPENE